MFSKLDLTNLLILWRLPIMEQVGWQFQKRHETLMHVRIYLDINLLQPLPILTVNKGQEITPTDKDRMQELCIWVSV